MRVLLTGGTGFVGAHVVRALLRADCQVAVLARARSDRWRVEELLPRLTFLEGDLRDLGSVEPEIAAFSPDTVIHLAWEGVTNRHRNEVSQLENVAITARLLECAARVGVKNWLGLGSQAEYGPRNGPINEGTPTKPTTMYGLAKLSAHLLGQHYSTQFDMRFAWLRLFSAYGPMDDPSWLIPYVTLTLLRGERPDLTAGTQLWDYIYASDVANAIYQTAASPNAIGVFNLGSGRAQTVRGIVERIRALVAPTLDLSFGAVPFRPDQVMHLQADVTRLKTIVGWAPRVDLDEGLAATAEWYRENHARFGI